MEDIISADYAHAKGNCKAKRSYLVSRNWPGEIFSSLTSPHGRMCVRIFIFCLKQTKKHTYRNKKQKNLKKLEK